VKTQKRILQVFRTSPDAYYRWTAYEWLTVGTTEFAAHELLGWSHLSDPYNYYVVTDTLYVHNIYFGIFTLPRIE
jgi:hypothetical protein